MLCCTCIVSSSPQSGICCDSKTCMFVSANTNLVCSNQTECAYNQSCKYPFKHFGLCMCVWINTMIWLHHQVIISYCWQSCAQNTRIVFSLPHSFLPHSFLPHSFSPYLSLHLFLLPSLSLTHTLQTSTCVCLLFPLITFHWDIQSMSHCKAHRL